MTTPLISILIPVYNRGSLLKHTVESARNQTYGNIEIIIVDNCSDDDTWDVCNYYSRLDSRIRIFRNDSNIGPVRNWQSCVSKANGQYAKLLFSDDLLLPECLEKCMELFSSDDVGFVFSSVVCGATPWEGKNFYNFKDASGHYPASDFLFSAIFGTSTPVSPAAALFRTESLARNILDVIPSPTIHNFKDHGAGPDLLVYLKSATEYSKVGYIREQLVYFRAHSDSITISSNKNFILNAYRQARIWFAENHFIPEALKFVYACEWKSYCRREHSWSLPSKVLGKFSFRKKTLGLSEALLIRVLSSGMYRQRLLSAIAKFDNLIES